jgi:hypothetical protein
VRVTEAPCDTPAEFLAMRLYSVIGTTTLAAPEITQLELFTVRWAGRLGVPGFVPQAVIAPPFVSKLTGDIVTALPAVRVKLG